MTRPRRELMTSSTTIEGLAGTGGTVGDDSPRRPVKLDDPVTVATFTGLTTADGTYSGHVQLREEWGDLAPVELEPGVRAWLVTGYRTIVAMARGELPLSTDTSTWSGSGRGAPAASSPWLRPLAAGPPTVEQADGHLHDRLRAPFDDMLTAIDEAEVSRITEDRCEGLIDGFAGTGVADLIREYVAPMPYLTLGAVLGFDADDARRVFDLSARGATGRDAAVLHEVNFLLSGQTAARRSNGEPTPAGLLARHTAYQSTAEVAHNLLSFTATADRALRAWLAQTLFLALTDDGFAVRLARGRLGTDEALDEVLWTAAPVTALAPRIAAEDFVLDNKLVQAGDAVLLAVGAIGSDPSIRGEGSWDSSGSRAHLTFGVGSHACPVPGLARLIVRTASETLHRRLTPTLATSTEDLVWAPDLRFRLLESLPVVFRPEPPVAPDSGP